jgi:signal peptidase I
MAETPVTPSPADRPASAATWLWDWVKSILFALVVWLFLRTFVIEAFHIPSPSMENTLLEGDFLFVNKFIYGSKVPLLNVWLPAWREPRRGDIVIFDSIEEDLKVVKRLIGLPGDTLQMVHGVVIRNGRRLDEPYTQNLSPDETAGTYYREKMYNWQVHYLVGRDTAGYRPDLHDWGPVVVPKDSLFVMGDNRDSSYDGRYWGFLPRRNLRGTPLFIYYSYDMRSWKPLPGLTAIRWRRFFTHPH